MTIDAAHLAIALVVLNIIGAILGSYKLFGEIGRQSKEAEKQSNAAAERFAKLEFQTHTMWAFLVGDMMTGARNRGVVQEKSPPVLDGRFVKQFDSGFSEQLRSWYREHNYVAVSQDELIMYIAREWKDQLIEKVCNPLGVNLGDALVAAVYICKGGQQGART